MSKTKVYFEKDVIIETAFKNEIIGVDDEYVLFLFSDFNNEPHFKTKQMWAYLYQEIESLSKSLNGNLHTKYFQITESLGGITDNVAIANHEVSDDTDKQALWVKFQDNFIKIQFSKMYENKFREFYSANQIEFDYLFNTNPADFDRILSANKNDIRKAINRVSVYRLQKNWINLTLVDKTPLELCFKFIREIKLLAK